MQSSSGLPCIVQICFDGHLCNTMLWQVKGEHLALYLRYAPLWEKEETERKQRWASLLATFNDDSAPQGLSM